MPRCFVMQPFDRGTFDARYDDVLEPAIRAAGIDPYRVDRDPTVSIPIDDIEREIRNSDVCLAEISTDNPNVWFELGYAIACGKEVVLVCSEQREKKFPFDIQHRNIITYRPDSLRDFEALKQRVTERLAAVLRKERQLATIADSPISETEGLEVHEIAALATIMESGLDPDNAPTAYSLKQDVGKAGFTDIAAVLAVRRLQSLGLVELTEGHNYNGEAYAAFVVTDRGEAWLLRNQDKLVLRKRPPAQQQIRTLPF